MNINQITLIATTIFCLLESQLVRAQISPDGTIPTQVEQSDKVFEITGGEKVGTNLFHSFEQFSIPTDGEAFFNNVPNVENIINRITGNSLSNIDGSIRANGSANLFLLNPNGIIFGPNASLNIGGSFLGSTASSINFADGTEFSAVNPSSPILTLAVPVELRFNSNSGSVQVRGLGHPFTVSEPNFSPFRRLSVATGLTVRPGKTLALVGSGLNLEGGNLTAFGGRVELGSVNKGNVYLIADDTGFTLNYEEIQQFNDISLAAKASVDASGLGGNSIQLQGKNLTISGGSIVLIQNQGLAPAGNITLTASERLQVSSTSSDGLGRSAVVNEAFKSQGGNIAINTGILTVDGGGAISTRAYNTARGGDITVQATDSIYISGFSSLLPEAASTISGLTLGSGQGGNVTLSGNQLLVDKGATVGTLTLQGTGDSGSLQINAEEVTVTGVSPSKLASSIISSTAGSGNGGRIVIKASFLNVLEGGQISSSTGAGGNAGEIFIKASKLNLISSPNLSSIFELENQDFLTSRIVAISALPTNAQQKVIGLPSELTGNSGSITIEADSLFIDRARISVSNASTGITGQIEINTNSLINRGGIISSSGLNTNEINPFKGGNIEIYTNLLDAEGGSISTSSRSLNSGNILLKAEDSLLLNNSNITARATDDANGGNITINTPNLNIIDNSQITVRNDGTGDAGNLTINSPSIFLNNSGSISAATVSGEGGNITINSSDLRLNNDSTITATAGGTGNGGNITINTDTLTALQNSDLTANAFKGQGGNIDINAKGIFLSPDSSITASSELGTDGEVRLSVNQFPLNLDNFALSFNPIPQELLIPTCTTTPSVPRNRLVVEAKGGIPTSPGDSIGTYNLEALAPLGQALGMQTTADGRIFLTGCIESKN